MSSPTPDTGSLVGTALDSYGHTFSEDRGRDAIHLAVKAVQAGERLWPGVHIGLAPDGMAYAQHPDVDYIGIVDPFLEGSVMPGQWFWLTLYPRTITSLRHGWTHPAFDVVDVAVLKEFAVFDPRAAAEAEARAWIEIFAAEIDQTVSKLMAAAEQWEQTSPNGQWGGEYTYDNTESYKGTPDERWKEFWRYYEVLKGSPLDEGVKRESFFTCSC